MSKFKGEVEDLDGTVQMASDAMLSWLREIDGYRGLVALSDQSAGTACFITFWENGEAAAKSRASRASLRTQLAATAGAEVVGTEEYTVIFTDGLG